MDRSLGLKSLVVFWVGVAACAADKAAAPEMESASAAPVNAAEGGRPAPASGGSAGSSTSSGAQDKPSMSQPSAAAPSQTASAAGAIAAGGAGAGASAGVAGQAGATAPAAGSGGANTAGAMDAGAPDTSTADGGAADSLLPPQMFLPPASGPCPEFQNGYVMFAPDGMQRRVLLYMSDAAMTKDGPLIFSWHSTLPNPEDATSWIGRAQIEEITAQGGIVAAPTTGYPNETRPWDNTPMGAQGVDGDERLMDEIVACANEKVGIDLRHIHATGMSAGGLKSADVSLRRSGYLASVVVYSGGLVDGQMPPDQDPNNKLAAMILYGGPTDISPVDGINYTDASNRYRDLLRSKGRLAFLCNHGGGHSVPADSQASAWQFMQDHPYGVRPDPYEKGLPDGFLRYCMLN